MNKIIYSLVYNRKKSLNKRGVALVQVEAYLNRKKKYFSTKVYLRPDQWDAKKLLVKNHPNADDMTGIMQVVPDVIMTTYIWVKITITVSPIIRKKLYTGVKTGLSVLLHACNSSVKIS